MARLLLVGAVVAMATLTGGAVGTLQQPSPRAERIPFGARGSTFVARVTRVSDGDTIDVTTSANGTVRLRLEGIDAPESGQPFGQVARNFTRQLAFDQLVTVRVLDRDEYDRLVVRVISQGKDVSVELLKAGLAWHYMQYSSDVTLAAAEQDARRARRGLWAGSNPVPPWVARRSTQPRGPPAQATPPDGPLHGNTRSRIYHRDSCPNARCSNCTAAFGSENAARAAGYRRAGDCF